MQLGQRFARCLLLLAVGLASVTASQDKSVITSLVTKWAATSLVAETRLATVFFLVIWG